MALAVLTAAAAALPALSAGPFGPSASAAPAAVVAAAPTHQVAVSGAGVSTYPAFSAGVDRYGITTTSATAGTVTVTASTSDPAGRVRVNGKTLTGGSRTLTGLTAGDEIAVFFEDSGGVSRHSFIYLPTGFPTLQRTTPDPAPGALAPGHVLLTLTQYGRPTPPPLDSYETAVDLNGVPAFAGRTPFSRALNRQPNGQFSVFRGGGTSDPASEELVLLDDAFQKVGTRRTVGLVNTDGHDAIVQPDGTTWLMAHEPRSPGGPVDAIIQRIDPDGTVGFQWSSQPYVADAVRDIPDYAHITSFQVMADGDLLVSFRHLSAVFKIATSAHDGFAVGDVVWKLGGRDSDFDFAGGDLGPCAPHTARELPNGNILLFDNGSWTASTSWCVDPADRTGPPVQRLQSRVVEYDLDAGAGTATVASNYAPQGWFAIFAGSAFRLANGNTLIGWGAAGNATASEINGSGQLLWQLRDPSASTYVSHHAVKAVVPDVTAPVVSVALPAAGGSYGEGTTIPTDVTCTDRGGSSLQSCDGPATLDTSSPGTRTATFTARDGAGRTTTVTRTYTVRPAGVDASVRVKGAKASIGVGEIGAATAQRAKATITRPGGKAKATIRLTNTGVAPASLAVDLRTKGKGFRVKPGQGLTTPVLAPGQSYDLKVTVQRKAGAEPGARVLVTVAVVVNGSPARADAVSLRVTAGKPAPGKPTNAG